MDERTGYRGGYHDDDYQDEEDGQQYQENLADDISWRLLADPGYDPDYDPEEGSLEDGLEDYQEQPEPVEHPLDHVAADAGQLDAEARYGWRAKARLRRQGRFVPPDMRTCRWPTFVRVEELQNRGGG